MDEYEAGPLLLQMLEDMIDRATQPAMSEERRHQILREAQEAVAAVRGQG